MGDAAEFAGKRVVADDPVGHDRKDPIVAAVETLSGFQFT